MAAARFHIDESADPKLPTALRAAGVDVTTTVSAGLRQSDDPEQLDDAVATGA